MLAAGSPELSELALVLADSFPPPTAPGLEPNDLLTRIGVSYLTRENPLDYILLRSQIVYFFPQKGQSLASGDEVVTGWSARL